MGTVLNLKKNLVPLQSKELVYEILFDVIRSFEAYLIDLNLIQLSKGEDIFGKTIGTYSAVTEEIAKKPPRPKEPKIFGKPYNFEWSGDFFRGFKLDVKNQVAIFTSRDSKTPMLIDLYGDIFGLNDDNLREAIQEKIAPNFINQIRKIIDV